MIDTHIHLLPGVDDGAKNMDVAIQMLHWAINEGVDEMILTPHFNIPVYNNQNVEKQYNLLREYILAEKISMKLHLGNEIYLSEENLEGIRKNQAHTMGISEYLLVELPFYHFYPFHEAMINDLQTSGYKILLAHVERYQIFIKKPDKLVELLKKDLYVQMTSSYIIDNKTRRKALKMIEHGLIQVVASDGHDVERRPPAMKMAYDIVARAFGEGCAKTLFVNNPRSIIQNDALTIPFIKKSKILGFRRTL